MSRSHNMKGLISYSAFPFFILLELSTLASSLKISKPIQPKISLSGYIKEDSIELIYADDHFLSKDNYQNDFISKNGSDFIISAQTTAVIFSCDASYPITWKFPFPKQLGSPMDIEINLPEYRMSELNKEDPNPISTRYKLLLSVSLKYVAFLSVALKCVSVENQVNSESRIHIFVADKSSLEYQGQTLQIPAHSRVKTNDKMYNFPSLILPCRPSSPKVTIVLEIGSRNSSDGIWTLNSTTWTPFYAFDGNKFSFDPKAGFSLHSGFLGDHIFRLYRCSVFYTNDDGGIQLDPDKFVISNVTEIANNSINSANLSLEAPLLQQSIILGKASVQLRYNTRFIFIKSQQLWCCSGIENKPPKLYVSPCVNHLNCQIVNKIMRDKVAADVRNPRNSDRYESVIDRLENRNQSKPADCRRRLLSGPSTLVICKGESVDYADQFIHLFKPDLSGPVEGRIGWVQQGTDGSSRISLSGLRNLTSLSQYESATIQGTRNVAQKMALQVGHVIFPGDTKPRHGFPIRFTDLNQQPLDAAVADFTFSRLSILLGSKKAGSEIHMKEYDRDVYYEGEPLHFICFGLKLFYAFGPHVRLNWKNGTKSTLVKRYSISGSSDDIKLFLSGNVVLFEGDGTDLVPFFARATLASQEMSSVDCWMPVRNGSKWDKISKSLKVLPSVTPEFAEVPEEIVYVYLGDVEKNITCTVMNGAPFPNLSVIKDGQKQGIKWDDWPKNNTKSSTKFEHGQRNDVTETESVDTGKHLIRLNIVLRNITLEDQVVWSCIASNVNGTVTRTVKVFVLERTSIVLPISLGIAGVLCAIALGILGKVCYNKGILKCISR